MKSFHSHTDSLSQLMWRERSLRPWMEPKVYVVVCTIQMKAILSSTGFHAVPFISILLTKRSEVRQTEKAKGRY